MNVPSKEEREFNDRVIVPLATEDYYQAVVIIQRTSKDLVEVFQCGASTDDAIDLVIHGHVILHEVRRQDEEAEDDGA